MKAEAAALVVVFFAGYVWAHCRALYWKRRHDNRARAYDELLDATIEQARLDNARRGP